MKIGLRALFGFGNAQLVSYFPCPYPTAGFAPCYEPVGIDVGFAVFEPQASILVRLGQKWTLDVSGGYRMIGDADGLEGRLQSGFGGIGLRFGSF